MRRQIEQLISNGIQDTVPSMLQNHLEYHPMALAYNFVSGEGYNNQTCDVILPSASYRYINGSTPENPEPDFIGHVVQAARGGDVTNPYWMDVIHESKSTISPKVSKEDAIKIINNEMVKMAEKGFPVNSLKNFRDYFVKVPFQATIVHGLTVNKRFYVLGPAHQLFSDITSFSQSDSQVANAYPSGMKGNAPSDALRAHGDLKERWANYLKSSIDLERPKHSDQRGWAQKDGNAEITMKDDVIGLSVDDGVSIYMNRTSRHLILQADTIDIVAQNVRWNGAPLNDNLVSYEDVEDTDGVHVPSQYNEGMVNRHEFMARQEAIEGAKIDLMMLPDVSDYKVMGPLMGEGKYGVKLNSIIQGTGRLAGGAYEDVTTFMSNDYNDQMLDGQFITNDRWGGSERMTSKPVANDTADSDHPEEGPDLQSVDDWHILIDHKTPHVSVLSALKEIRKKYLAHKHLAHATDEHHIRPGEMRSYPFQEVFKSRLVEVGRIVTQNISMITSKFSDPMIDKEPISEQE